MLHEHANNTQRTEVNGRSHCRSTRYTNMQQKKYKTEITFTVRQLNVKCKNVRRA